MMPPDPSAMRNSPKKKARFAVLGDRQACVADAVNETERKDGSVLPEVPVRKPTAQQREKVDAVYEGVKNLFGGGLAFQLGKHLRGGEEQRRST